MNILCGELKVSHPVIATDKLYNHLRKTRDNIWDKEGRKATFSEIIEEVMFAKRVRKKPKK